MTIANPAGSRQLGELNGRKSRLLTQEEFDGLLEFLDTDRNIAGQKYEGIRGKLIRFFEGRGCKIACELADSTMDLVARKIGLCPRIEVQDGDPYRYFRGVARNLIREYWRSATAREASIHAGSLLDQRYVELDETDEAGLKRQESDRNLELLELCLQELRTAERELFSKYFERDTGRERIAQRRILAASLGVTSGVLRVRAHRLRRKVKYRFEYHRRCQVARESGIRRRTGMTRGQTSRRPGEKLARPDRHRF